LDIDLRPRVIDAIPQSYEAVVGNDDVEDEKDNDAEQDPDGEHGHSIPTAPPATAGCARK